MSRSVFFFLLALAVPMFLACSSGTVFARDAAFLSPGASGGMGVSDEAIRVDPKMEIDVGETPINISKRATIFFVNQTSMPVKIEKIALSSDSLVTAEETANDCTKQGTIAPLSRCSVEVSVVPTGSGTWSIDVLMTHNGAGRITRARLIGKTAAAGSGEGKGTGLDISSRDIKPIDFGTVSVGEGKVVRSTLMVNNSVDPITIYAIDVIEAENGLQKLKQGCAVDMELSPGGSCPVTLLWEPREASQISTDLIIRHSGKLGFAVIPVRGTATGIGSGIRGGSMSGGGSGRMPREAVPLPLSARDLEKEVGRSLTPVSDRLLGGGRSISGGGDDGWGGGKLTLIGTIGDRALFLLPNGNTSAFSAGDSFDVGGGTAKVLSVGAHSAEVMVGGKKTTLLLETASSLVLEAVAKSRQAGAAQGKHVPLSGADEK